jgi:hypothetical protein
MKKIVLIFTITLLFFSSCKKKDEENKDFSSCPYKFEGGYSGRYETNNGFGPTIHLAIISYAGNENKLLFICNDFYGTDTLNVSMNCNLNSFTIPVQQTKNNCYINGYGSFDKDNSKLTLFYSDNCNFSLKSEFIKTRESGFAFYPETPDYSLPIGRSISKNIFVVKYGNYNENVFLNFKSNNADITGTFSNNYGSPDFVSSLSMTAPSTITSYYGAQAIIQAFMGNDSLIDKSYIRFYRADCSSDFSGVFYAEEYCNNNYLPYTVNLIAQSETRILIQGFNNGADNIYADVNCDKKSIIVSEQPISNGIISGSGTFNENYNYNNNQIEYYNMVINYEINNGGVITSCRININN